MAAPRINLLRSQPLAAGAASPDAEDYLRYDLERLRRPAAAQAKDEPTWARLLSRTGLATLAGLLLVTVGFLGRGWMGAERREAEGAARVLERLEARIGQEEKATSAAVAQHDAERRADLEWRAGLASGLAEEQRRTRAEIEALRRDFTALLVELRKERGR